MEEELAYIGCKIIKAVSMTKKAWEASEHCPVVVSDSVASVDHDGYKVIYPDGYVSWSPKDVFESAYRVVTETEKDLLK